MNAKDFEKLPVYPSTKSTSTVRYRDRIEMELISYLDNKSEIVDFYQPRIAIPVRSGGSNFNLEIDFIVRYADENRTDWIHIQRDPNEHGLPQCTVEIPNFREVFTLVVIRIDSTGIRFVEPLKW